MYSTEDRAPFMQKRLIALIVASGIVAFGINTAFAAESGKAMHPGTNGTEKCVFRVYSEEETPIEFDRHLAYSLQDFFLSEEGASIFGLLSEQGLNIDIKSSVIVESSKYSVVGIPVVGLVGSSMIPMDNSKLDNNRFEKFLMLYKPTEGEVQSFFVEIVIDSLKMEVTQLRIASPIGFGVLVPHNI